MLSIGRVATLLSLAALAACQGDLTPPSAVQHVAVDPSLSIAPGNGPSAVFLHGTGGTANPSNLSVDDLAPASATAKYKDSPAIRFSGGNPWTEIGTWTAAGNLFAGNLTALGAVHAWLGLKNSDDIGTRFDVRVEAYRNGSLAASGESFCIQGIVRNAESAKEVAVTFNPFPAMPFNGASDVLSLKVLTRIGTHGTGTSCGGHSNAVGLRLYFDATSRAATVGITVSSPMTGDFWTTQASMPTARFHLGVGVVNGILYAVGGNSPSFSGGRTALLEAYDPGTNTWATRAPMPNARDFVSVGVVNGILYAVGGEDNSGVVATVQAYDPAANSWSDKAPMPTARVALGVGVMNGILYAVGGSDNNGVRLATVEAYDPVSNSWTPKASMPTARDNLGAGVVNGVIYVVGGLGSGGLVPLATVEAYDPVADSWTTKTSMPTARNSLGAEVVNGVLYVVGGFSGSGYSGSYLGTLEAYDPVANSWTTKASLPAARATFAVGVANGILYVVGGELNFGNTPLATNEAYQP